jgi:hypothetical protein
MVKASGQIEQDLASLQKKTEQMAEALEPIYQGYLKALSESGKRQLVLAAYHLCTQAYPDRFLALSWDQRNQLQKGLQAIAAQIYEQLMQRREQSKVVSRRSQNQDGLAFLQRLLEARAASSSPAKDSDVAQFSTSEHSRYSHERLDRDILDDDDLDDDDLDDDTLDEDLLGDDFEDINFETEGLDERVDLDEEDLGFEMEVPAADQRLTLDEEEDLLAALEGLARRSIQINESGHLSGYLSGPFAASANAPLADEAEKEQPLAPIHLVKQQMLLEKSIREVFKTVSEEANELLQKSNVMPNFPRALMAAAADPRGRGEPMNAVPNVVRVSVRVMHGEALLEPDDDNGLEGSSDPRLSRDPSGTHSGTHSGRPGEAISRKFNRRDNASFDRKGGRDSSESPTRRPRRMAAREMMSVEALPELAAISLRLSEVEFTDPTVSAWRGRLRQKLGELKILGVRYKKTQRSLETAKAEDAWRSSWSVQDDTHT